MKRTLDAMVALVGLLLLSPLLAAIALLIWVEDFHSPWFRGVRVGLGGAQFKMLKFRSMRPDAWRSGVNSTAARDPRITRVGYWLRWTKMDELPQLWNVLTGEMSLVGPRPQVVVDAALYTAAERRIFSLRPGITDVASIVFSDEGEILAGAGDPDLLYNQIIRPWKSRLALLYGEQRSGWYDLRILGLTLAGLVSRRRALDGVAAILVEWNAPPLLRRMAGRNEPLLAYPPPGAGQVVAAYREASA